MASRQEEKKRLRERRLAAEQAAAAAVARRKRLTLAGGGLLAAVLIAAVAVLAFSGLGGSSGGTPGPAAPVANAALPQQQTSDLQVAARKGGCELQNPPVLGRTHETKTFTAADYNTNPPTSGDHNPVWYDDGVYAPGDTPKLGQLVHTLEHGRIDVQYRPGAPSRRVAQLEALLAEQSNGYHMLLFQNATAMKYAVAATAWGHLLGCPTINDQVFDALRTFRERYVDKAPEQVP
jgi:hypothetical protein